MQEEAESRSPTESSIPSEKFEPMLAATQYKTQKLCNNILDDALNGKFKIKIDEVWETNPKATELESLRRYELITESMKDTTVHFKQRSLENGPHANGEPTGCSFFMTMELCMEGKEYQEGGLHHLVTNTINLQQCDPNFFWGMVLNYNTFGTVAPFHTKCHCKFPKMPPKYKQMQKKWDARFARAKACITDVQCMFADTETGCHRAGLDGDSGCKFKHDIEV